MSKLRTLSILCMAGALGLLTGCETTKPVPATAGDMQLMTSNNAAGVDTAEVQLAEAADSVSHSLTQLKAIQQAATPPKQAIAPPNPSSYGMGKQVSVDWYGPVGPLTEKIAALTHYNLRVLGTPPSIPIVVTVNAKNIPIGQVLQNVGYQCGKRADIVVYPSSRVIELRYAAS